MSLTKKIKKKIKKIFGFFSSQLKGIEELYISKRDDKKLDNLNHLHKILKTLEKPAAKVNLLEKILSPQNLRKRKNDLEFFVEASLILIEIYEKAEDSHLRISNLLEILEENAPLVAAKIYEKLDQLEKALSIYEKEKNYHLAFHLSRYRGDAIIQGIPFFLEEPFIYQQYNNKTQNASSWYLKALDYLLLDKANSNYILNFSLSDHQGEINPVKCPARIILESSFNDGAIFIRKTKDIFKDTRNEENKKIIADLYKKFIDKKLLEDTKLDNAEVKEIIHKVIEYHEEIGYLYTQLARIFRYIGEEEGEKRIIKNIIKERLREITSFSEDILKEFSLEDLSLLIEELELLGKKSFQRKSEKEAKNFYLNAAYLSLKYIDYLKEKGEDEEVLNYCQRAVDNFLKADDYLKAMDLIMEFNLPEKAKEIAPLAIKKLIHEYEIKENKAFIEKAIKFAKFSSLYKEEASLLILLNKPEEASNILREHGDIEEAFNILLEASLSSKCLEIIKEMEPSKALNYLNKLTSKYRQLIKNEKDNYYLKIYRDRVEFFTQIISQILSSEEIDNRETIYASIIELMLKEEEKGDFEKACQLAQSALKYSRGKEKTYLEEKIKAYKDSITLF